jgi:hypothetical protein
MDRPASLDFGWRRSSDAAISVHCAVMALKVMWKRERERERGLVKLGWGVLSTRMSSCAVAVCSWMGMEAWQKV